MRLYLDQMFRVEVADRLRAADHDVIRAADVGQARADDESVLKLAIAEERTIITLDEHFGDWTVLPLSRHPGVIRLKIHPATPEQVLALLLPFLSGRTQDEFRDHLVIVSAPKVRWIKTC